MHKDIERDKYWTLFKELVLNKLCNFLLSCFLGFQVCNKLL